MCMLLDPRRAPTDDAGDEGFSVMEERVLSVLALVMELMREAGSLPDIVTWSWLRGR